MNQNNILDLLEKDARLNAQDLSDILNEPKDEIEKTIKELEDKKIICGYHTVINFNRARVFNTSQNYRFSYQPIKWTFSFTFLVKFLDFLYRIFSYAMV